MKVIIAVAGMPGSGKSTVSKMLSESLGCPIVSMGDVVREEVKRRGLPLDPKVIEEVARDLRRVGGPEIVAKMLTEKISKLMEEHKCVIVDGLRSLEEAKVFSRLAITCIVAVHSSPSKRLDRLLTRGREGDIKSDEEFIMRDRANLKLGLGEVIALADFMIVNDGELADLVREIRRVVGELLNEWRGCGRGRD